MKNGILIIILIIVIISGMLLFTNKEKDITIDINKISEDIMKNIKFEDELNKMDSDTVSKLYDINNATSQLVYMSSGATAEEIAIFEFKNKEECKIALENANKRIEERKQSFKDYMPKEMKKLEDAIIKNTQKYLIVCVTNDQDTVEEILNKYIK